LWIRICVGLRFLCIGSGWYDVCYWYGDTGYMKNRVYKTFVIGGPWTWDFALFYTWITCFTRLNVVCKPCNLSNFCNFYKPVGIRIRSVYTNTRALAELQILHTLHGEIVHTFSNRLTRARVIKESRVNRVRPP
jgi:hypothetical protein